ncbi:fibronectin type III domain-containing protein [Gordonia jinghuaiqii]|uniref:Fibronectin type III domain-containing protein n=1 Tax=Gordonia jinghuaiqii TaxID=2758710 RepID=A0A7D7LSM1_9ACTN|nr:fibronectin type III domain-containing protein [Gordonia jinghuaiqii]MCR5979747.1 fibronectin type III domain-containing protein [Gordonia jinghuaiqii]QMT00857.1 fibronectin type III domain-containing protein [Gordonia jinghuaiqii]
MGHPVPTQPPGPATPREPFSGPWPIVLIVVLAGAVAVGGFIGVRALGSPDVPQSPGGLTLEAQTGHVAARWDAVSGAEGYQLVRDDGLVVYEGSRTEAVDAEVAAGEHVYRVMAVRSGVSSPAGPARTVRTGESWGQFAPLVAQFPQLLPQAPGTSARWRDAECVRRYSGGRDEVGPSETGTGKVRTVFVLRCAAGAVDRPYGVFWFASKDALNAEYQRSSSTSRPVSWRHGTGLIDENGRGVFKITDDPAQELAMIVVLRTQAQDVLETVDSMPI